MVGWLGNSSSSSWEAGKSCNSTFLSLFEKWFKQWFGWAQSRAAHFESHPNVDPESLDSIVHCVCLFASGTPLRRRLVARRDWGQSPTCTRPWFQSWCLDSRFQIFFFKFRFFHLFYMLVLSGQFVWHVIRPLVFFVSLL